MPKRKEDIIINRYRRKIKKLEEEKERKRRRIIIESSSDSDEPSNNEIQINSTSTANINAVSPLIELGDTPEDIHPTEEIAINSQESNSYPDLDIVLLVALGKDTGTTPKFGEKIHHSLAQRWEPILKKGLTTDIKDKLLKEYLIPENCTLLQVPKLNNEIAAAISEAARHRDKRKESEQQQLGVGIATINKALTLMLTSDNKIEAIRIISDGCRILTDLHYQETQARINVINYSLAKPFLNIVQNSERDETLYGNKLAENIKASKAIEKQGLSIRKFVKTQKTNVLTIEQPGPSTRSYQYGQANTCQGNWSGPSRFQQNRGGRRGLKRPNVTIPANRWFPPTQRQTLNTSCPNKPRAPVKRQ